MCETVFVSFSGNDRETARQVVQGLKAEGIQIWWDEEGIGWGRNWIHELQDALSQCSVYLILYGASGERRWVAAELSYALKRHYEGKMPILPLLLSGTTAEDLPPFLSTFQVRPLAAEPDYQALANSLRNAVQEVADIQPQYDPEVCPFPGLGAYNEADAKFFFGRQIETLDALRKLGMGTDNIYHRWLQVEGASGAGKSSLVKAGLIPAIKRGWFSNGQHSAWQNWTIAPPMRPGDQPLLNLANAIQKGLAECEVLVSLVDINKSLKSGDEEALKLLLRQHVPAKTALLLVVDQLEEIFTMTSSREEREQFDRLLANALDDTDGPLHLITTIRSDFMLRFGELPTLESRINDQESRYLLPSISKAGLKDIVRSPARLAGLRWSEKSLPKKIVKQAVKAGRGALPLLGNLLRLLWERREENQLSKTVFDELDGVGGALTTSADGLLNSFTEDECQMAKKLLLALVNDERGNQNTRRTIKLDLALKAAGGEKARVVLNHLSGQRDKKSPAGTSRPRLITVWSEQKQECNDDEKQVRTESYVELSHEALLATDYEGKAYWKTLQDWLQTHRKELEDRDLLESMAKDWHKEGEPRFSGLSSGKQLKKLALVKGAKEPASKFIKAGKQLQRMFRTVTVSVLLFATGAVENSYWLYKHDIDYEKSADYLKGRWLNYFKMYQIEPKLAEIPKGHFLMGSADEKKNS